LESRRKYEIERIKDAVGPFAVLGLLRDATAEDVKARRTELQQMLRPDQVTSEALTDATERVNEAYETLNDAEKRAAYETEHPLQQRGRDAPGGGGDWELDRAMKRRHEETLQMLLDPLDTLLPPKGVNTTLTSKAKLSARVANHPAFKLACQLTVTQARIDFYEPTAKIEYGVHGELVPFSLDKDFRAATIVCTVAVGEWSLDITCRSSWRRAAMAASARRAFQPPSGSGWRAATSARRWTSFGLRSKPSGKMTEGRRRRCGMQSGRRSRTSTRRRSRRSI